jgi:hypothetical protein
MYVTDAALEAAPDDVTYYLQAYYPESEPSLIPIRRASSSSIDADPNPLSTLLLDDISQRVASVIGTITRILVERSAFPVEAELLDWDAAIEAAPSRPTTTINVSIEYVGRSKPLPVDDSWE